MMNSFYLDKKNLKTIGQEFSKTDTIHLEGFVEENLYEQLKRNPTLKNQIFDSEELEYIIKNITQEKVKFIFIISNSWNSNFSGNTLILTKTNTEKIKQELKNKNATIIEGNAPTRN